MNNPTTRKLKIKTISQQIYDLEVPIKVNIPFYYISDDYSRS